VLVEDLTEHYLQHKESRIGHAIDVVVCELSIMA